MTRDTSRIRDDRSDDDILTALWASAPFPYLPHDAPDALKNLTIDIDDPKRVHVIHHANRRHGFQLLVERYIRQLRYGCQSKVCDTPTCFTCRKRLADGAPIRRYNSTSARILAVHLASQDNPEQGLCHHPIAETPIYLNKHVRLSAPRNTSAERKIQSNGGDSRSIKSLNRSNEKPIPSRISSTSSSTKSAGASMRRTEVVNRDEPAGMRKHTTSIIEENTTTDHKSFVQNMFGTVAIKMVEWLTPRNLEALTRPKDQDTSPLGYPSPLAQTTPSESTGSPGTNTGTNTPASEPDGTNGTKASESTSSKASSPELMSISETSGAIEESSLTNNDTTKTSAQRKMTSKHSNTISSELKAESHPNPKMLHNNPNTRRKIDSTESHTAKGILNLSTTPKMADTSPNDSLISHQPVRAKSRPSRHSITTSPTLLLPETDAPSLAPKSSQRGNADAMKPPNPSKSEPKLTVDEKAKEPHNNSLQESSKPTSFSNEGKLPQSLSSLPIDVINLICDILQNDNTGDKHLLHPERIEDTEKRYPGTTRLSRNASKMAMLYPSSMKRQWRQFIDQSLFSVLSRPESLIQSFSDQDGKLFDTQTIWYCMLRMTRVAPYIVFDSLWIAAGALFRPPRQLEWAKESRNQSMGADPPISKADAARIINICLHALVAASPLLNDPRSMANMSRIRSHGIVMVGRETFESARLCLQYDDAFTDDLILRLARRVFAAIPTRRRFTELIELQQDIKGDENEQEDILEIILGTLKFLDHLDVTPLLNFNYAERMWHEKRMPTLLLDWARTVMLQDWDGKAEVPSDGSFGGALATIAAIYKNRKSLLLGDLFFRTEYFAERLDSIAMPLEWLSFQANQKTVHLLDYPYLFHPSMLVDYFRAINYSRMHQSFEEAKSVQGLIRATIAHESLMTDENSRYRLYDRLSTATSRYLILEVSREHILQDTFNSIWRREERELMRPLKIKLGEDAGEEGIDMGGVQKEFFQLAIAEALNPDYGTFTIDPTTKMTWFQPGSPEPLWKFELIGMIMSLAVYNGLSLPITFPKALYRKLLGESNTELHHISDGWPDLASGLTTLLEWDEKEGSVEDIFNRDYEFSVSQFGKTVTREMGISNHWPQFSESSESSTPTNAPTVTHENRNNYVSDYIKWLTDISIRPQFESFKHGFFTCIDPRSITLFDTDALQSLIEGIQEIDINEMRRATRYEAGFTASSPIIRDFWAIVKKYDLEQKKKLLEFITASDRVPMGGMANMNFVIQMNGGDDAWLPTSHTCFNTLLMPDYSGKEVLRRRLEVALEHHKGFGNY